MGSYKGIIFGAVTAVVSFIGVIGTIVGLLVDLPEFCSKYPKVCNYFQIQYTDNGDDSSKVDNKFSVNDKIKNSKSVSSQKSISSTVEKQYYLDNIKNNNVSVKEQDGVSSSINKTANKYNAGIVIQKVKSCNLKMSEDWSILKHQLSRYLKISENSSYTQFIEALNKKCAK